MNRRQTLKALLAVAAGSALLPACMQDEKSSVSYKNLKLTRQDEDLTAAFADTLIPKTNTPGAVETKAHLFALMMVDDCFPPADRENFQKGFVAFKDYLKKNGMEDFSKAEASKRQALLTGLENGKDNPAELNGFYQTMKRYILQGYTTSQFFLTNIQEYKLVPGPYYGCVPVNQKS